MSEHDSVRRRLTDRTRSHWLHDHAAAFVYDRAGDSGAFGPTVDARDARESRGALAQRVIAAHRRHHRVVGTDVSFCAIPAHYRLNGRVDGFGACVGILRDPPASIEMRVGDDMDIHMSVTASTGHPRYPLPSSSNSAVIDQVSALDVATATYRAQAPGDALLMTVGNCLVNASTPGGVEETFGSCPLVRIHVPAPTAFHLDVENRSSVNVVVSVVSDMAAWMPGFAPGQRGTVVINLAIPTNGIGIEIQDGKCGLLASKNYPTPTPFTLVIEDGDAPGAVRLPTLAGSAASPIPLPSNSIVGCGG